MYDAGILTVLAELTPWDPVAGAAVTVRVTNRDDARACILNGQTWWPVMTRAPRLERRMFDGNFSGQIGSSAGDFALSLDTFPDAMRYEWAERPAKIWIGRLGDAFGSYTLLFEGVMTGLTGEGGAAAVGLRVADGWMDGPLLTASYAGTGGAEGMAALKGQPKPLAIGAPRYAEGVLIDDVNVVLQLHGYGSIEGVEFALDRLVRFPAAAGNDASYAALVAASIAPGAVRTSLAAGLVRHGAPLAGVPSYLLKGDNTGAWHRRPGAVIARLAAIGGASGGQVDSASMAALDTAVAYDISLFLAEQVSVRGAVQDIAASCNAAAGVNWLGKLVAAKVGIAGTADLTLKPDGTALPPCGLPARLPVDSPFHRMRMSAAHAQRPHGPDEIAFTAQIVPAVTYSASDTYREGQMVIQPTNGITYLYINPTPTSGNAPPNGTYWQAVAGPPNWSVINNDGGKPEDGATNDARGNLLSGPASKNEAAGWSRTADATWAHVANSAAAGWAAFVNTLCLRATLSATTTASSTWVAQALPVGDAKKVFFSTRWAFGDGANADLGAYAYFYDVNGTYISNVYVGALDRTTAAAGQYATRQFSAAVPAGAVGWRPIYTKPSGTLTGSFRIDVTIAALSELGADVTATSPVGINFNARNDRNAAAVTAPTIATDGTAVDHTIATDGSCNISFEWSWGGTEADIDGFIVYVYRSASASAYTFGTTAAEEQTFFVAPDRRALLIYGVPADAYYTFGVRAYRIVDPDVNAAGRILSTLVKATGSGENPYRPSASVAFAGNVSGTVGGSAASTVAAGALAANNGVNSDGTIKDDKVGTPAIVDDAISGLPNAVGSGSFTTSFVTRATYTFTAAADEKYLVLISGLVIIGDAAAAGTYAEVQLEKNGSTSGALIATPVSRVKAVEQMFCFPITMTGLSGSQTLDLRFRASATHGAGDPHLVERAGIHIIKLNR